jgi:hypothetical protein
MRGGQGLVRSRCLQPLLDRMALGNFSARIMIPSSRHYSAVIVFSAVFVSTPLCWASGMHITARGFKIALERSHLSCIKRKSCYSMLRYVTLQPYVPLPTSTWTADALAGRLLATDYGFSCDFFASSLICFSIAFFWVTPCNANSDSSTWSRT